MDRDETTTASRLSRDAALVAGHYRVESPIGSGAMATVFRAHDERHGRKVALKVLRPRVAQTLAADRFLREIRVSAQLSHPHIVGLLDSGVHEGMLWYAMPFVEGETLRARLDREGALPLTEAVRIARELADALAAAHAMGIVHRDVKPENVMLSGRHALVMDFGIARAVRDAGGGGSLTQEGTAVGTPDYMAPEQAAADPQVTPAMDVFALGLVLYEMLVGRTPFAELPPARRLAALVRTPAPSVRKARPEVPDALAALITHCLQLAPEARPSTAAAVYEALEEIAADAAIGVATPAGGLARVPRPAGATPESAAESTAADASGRRPAAATARTTPGAAPDARPGTANGPLRTVLLVVLVVVAALLLWAALGRATGVPSPADGTGAPAATVAVAEPER